MHPTEPLRPQWVKVSSLKNRKLSRREGFVVSTTIYSELQMSTYNLQHKFSGRNLNIFPFILLYLKLYVTTFSASVLSLITVIVDFLSTLCTDSLPKKSETLTSERFSFSSIFPVFSCGLDFCGLERYLSRNVFLGFSSSSSSEKKNQLKVSSQKQTYIILTPLNHTSIR